MIKWVQHLFIYNLKYILVLINTSTRLRFYTKYPYNLGVMLRATRIRMVLYRLNHLGLARNQQFGEEIYSRSLISTCILFY